jgi:ribosomal protein S18 acetylase RimI-like enzyme
VSESFEIRLARPEEYDEIGEVTVRGYQHDGFLSASEDYASSLRDATSRAVGAELWVAVELATDRVLGSVTFCPIGSSYRELAGDAEGEFRMLAVDPSARGLGVGRALVQHCLDHSRDLGFGAVVICSLPAMTTAHALYFSLGFTRDPSLDWTPVAGVDLWGFRTALVSENRP